MSKPPTSSSDRPYKLQKETENAKRAKQAVFQPFAEQIGWIAYEWNRLQAAIGELFSDIVCPEQKEIGCALWHSTDNERAQRRMLKDALDAAKKANKVEQRAYDEVSWILTQFDSLAGRRNNAIHAPFVLVSANTFELRFEVVPQHFLGNPRAKELKDKSIMGEFRWYRDHLENLADFAEELHFALTVHEIAWPDRPRLRPRGDFETHTSHARKSKSK
jgi:hypothetical protein